MKQFETFEIKTGARGKRAGSIQDLLNHMPPSLLPKLTVDGAFGLKTQARVREFQRNRGLRVTGAVDRDTLDAITPSASEVEAIGEAFRAVVTARRNAHGVSVFDREWGTVMERVIPVGNPGGDRRWLRRDRLLRVLRRHGCTGGECAESATPYDLRVDRRAGG